MWVEDVEQLQKINTNLGGNYALRNSIDATSTATAGNSFTSIGSDNNAFKGKFDGIDYNIFGLTIDNNNKSNTGLFGETNGATIRNVTLVGGKITGGNNTGALVGHAINSTITNVVNSAEVNGDINVGGLIGASTNSIVENIVNTGSVHSDGGDNKKGGTVSSVGGLIGSMTGDSQKNSQLTGNSYNLGNVSGAGYNVGGLVGHAVNSTIGDSTNLVYNRMDVTGAYNVGGIVGNMEGSTVQNAENSGTVEATGYTTEGYTYHTGVSNSGSLPSGTLNVDDGTVTTTVNIANAGGIAGTSSDSEIVKVTNTADVSTATETGTQYTVNDLTYYTAGNVGGIVGRAEDTNISDATNRENEMRGAHNVGGVAGYFGGTGTVSGGINDGGDIMATGARYNDNFVRELIRPVGDSNESFIIGNIGGVVGYMDGDKVYVTGSANRGTVHSQDIEEENATNVLYTSQAANVGGVVGKIDRSDTKGLVEIKNNTSLAAVNNSYNTGDVRGYTGVGGVVGMMYNGEVASSYNLGYLRTTRIATNGENIEAVNMGGIVGDTTEGSRSKGVIIYDVYNKGQIGDDTYTYYARHVAGIVGRLSGTVEKAYNNGEIYNGYTATGGIAGWMYEGSINNAFNTGNITVYNHDSSTSQVGGIVGAASVASGDINLTNVYNLGTLRSFQANSTYAGLNHNVGANSVAGIIGAVMNNRHDLIIENAYTTGNIYAGVQNEQGSMELDTENDMVGSIYGENRGVKDNTGSMEYADIKRTNTYYIRPEDGVGFTQLGTSVNNKLYGSDNSNKGIDYEDRDNVNENENVYSYYDNGWYSLNFSSQSGGNVTGNTDNNWRLYPDGTPILNAFLPDSESYFDKYNNNTDLVNAGMDSVQYGTAYDPLLTIITANNNANGNLSFTLGAGDNELSISNAAGLVVYNAGLTLNNFSSSGSSSGYYGGLIYSDGVLTINATDNEGLAFGSGADIYGSSVALNADGTITIYGDVTATGNGTVANDDPDKAGSINIASNDSDINVYGTLTSATAGESVTIPGISGAPDSNWRPVDTGDSISDPSDSLNTIGERYEHTTTSSNVNGNITITANGKTDKEGNLVSGGNVNLYFGNKGEGITTTGGDLTVTGTGDVYLDSDLDIGGNLTLNGTGADSEVVLDITNIGQVQAKNELAENTDSKVTAAEKLHDFMHHFSNNKGDGANIYLNAKNSNDTKITVDMWDGEKFDLKKFDTKDADGTTHEFKTEIDFMNVTVNGKKLGEPGNKHVKDYTYIWVSDGEQLKGIQQSAKENNNFLDFNFALKNDINASDIGNGYEAIGGTTGYNGTFDGRGNRIIGLTVSGDNAGIFSTVGKGGVVKDVNIYSGTFTGKTTAGAVAGENNGRIEGIVTFGNTVTVTGNNGNAGGIVGINNAVNGKIVTNEDGTITLEPVDRNKPVTGIIDVESTGSVIAGNTNAIAGGLVGTNDGALGNSYSNSAVTANKGTGSGLGGVVGVNTANGNVQYVDSLGVTNGGAHLSNNVGGIIGINNGNMYSGYNESIVSGSSNVGGIIGTNAGTYNEADKKWESGTVSNVVNATSVTSDAADSKNVGGLVGTNTGSVTNGRNNGTITGTKYVGGLVGDNANANSILTNLVNDSSAEILGEEYVGGIAGSNSGTITADEKNDNLVNRGSITGNKYVGGVAGENKDGGTIANTLNSVVLHAKGENAQYFGGVVGQNSGEINGATNTSNIDITAVGGSYVGGIIGQNTKSGTLKGEIRNEGSVAGKSQVGGIIGENDNDYVLIGTEGNRLTVENDGSVDAQEGGAAGIFYENHGEIKYADISNSGVVNGGDKEGGTGGLFGINTGNITESTLTNSGTVIGGGIVGGLIGKNSGDAFNSSLTNTGSVIGKSDVGGLIGYNTGTVTGGRNKAQETDKDGKVTAENDSYYKYQIYNNGVVNVGTWNDKNSNGKVDDGEITGLQQGETSQNIGGLIGNNADEIATGGKKGSLTAGYNTGVINASGSTTVGGIAGSNSGTIDQVFNTVYNTDGTKGAITGGTNVGGLVGENTNNGTLSNAYNTTEVVGMLDNAVVGNAVGVNNDNATVSNVYDVTNTNNKLIGENSNGAIVDNSYTSAKQEESADGTDGITYISADKAKDKESYKNFADGTWKFYDGYSNPLLKVFLTDVEIKVDVDKINEYINNVYNGDAQYITDEDIDKLIAQGAITAPDDFTAYKNAKELINSISHTDAGTYNDWLYSGQIASSGSGETFNPNNLGYDIVLTADIDKATINISLDDIYRTYGDIDNIYSDADRTTGTTYGESYTIDTSNLNDVLQQYIKDNLQVELSSDGSLNGTDKTQNVGDYDWSLKVTLGGNNASNYQINSSDSASNVVVTGENKTHVEKANLTINLDEVIRNYGSTLITNNGGDYSATISGLVNGDDELGYTSDDLDITVTGDEALTGSNTGRVTNNAGDYTWSATVTGVDNSNLTNLSDNYNITVNGTGKSTVKKVQLTVDLDEVTRTYGNTVITNNNGEYSISNIQGLVNGDADLGYDVDDLVINVTSDTALTGNSTGEVTKDANGDYTWSATVSGKDGDLTNLSTNYEIVTTGTGKSTVNKADLIININDVETTYGTAFDESKYSYGFGNNGANGLVNGDVLDDVKDAIDSATGGYENTGAADSTNGKVTQDAKDGYSLSFNNELSNTNTLKNYNIITVNNGDSTVNKKQITIGANDEQILVGETPNYSGTDIDSVLVNGDSLNGNYHYGVEDSSIESVVGTYNDAIGVWIGGSFYDISNPDWSNLPGMSFFANYNVTFEPGTLTVSAYDIPEDWPHNRWDYLFGDNPFDRNENFRERKAEVNFVDGAMEI